MRAAVLHTRRCVVVRPREGERAGREGQGGACLLLNDVVNTLSSTRAFENQQRISRKTIFGGKEKQKQKTHTLSLAQRPPFVVSKQSTLFCFENSSVGRENLFASAAQERARGVSGGNTSTRAQGRKGGRERAKGCRRRGFYLSQNLGKKRARTRAAGAPTFLSFVSSWMTAPRGRPCTASSKNSTAQQTALLDLDARRHAERRVPLLVLAVHRRAAEAAHGAVGLLDLF